MKLRKEDCVLTYGFNEGKNYNPSPGRFSTLLIGGIVLYILMANVIFVHEFLYLWLF